MADNGNLTPRQLKAIEAMLTADTVIQAAVTAGVGPRSLHRWLAEDEAFGQALRAAQDKAMNAAVIRLAGETLPAVMTLATIHKDKETSAAVRVQAAQSLLALSLKMVEQRDLTQRIQALEDSITK